MTTIATIRGVKTCGLIAGKADQNQNSHTRICGAAKIAMAHWHPDGVVNEIMSMCI